MKLYKSDEFGRFIPTQGVTVIGGILEFWVPDSLAKWIKYDPRKLPVRRLRCVFFATVVVFIQQDNNDHCFILKMILKERR